MKTDAILFENARIIDPSQDLDRVARLLVVNGKVAAFDPKDGDLPPDTQRLNVRDRIIAPGFVDIGTELGEPGREEDERIECALTAALAGGFTSVVCSPHTIPPIDTAATVQFVQQSADRCQSARAYVLGCVSKARKGLELAEIGSLFDAGAVGLSDAPTPIENTALLKKALEYCTMFRRPIIEHPELASVSGKGVMHEDLTQLLLGIAPLPAEAEDLATARDLRLVEATGGMLHLSSISTSGSVDLCRRVRSRHIEFTVGVHVANTHMTDTMLRTFDSNCKVNPPLRSESHVQDICQGLADGTIDVISSGHRPWSLEKKMQELDLAPFGMTSLESTFGQVSTYLVHKGILDWSAAIRKLSTKPAEIMQLEAGSLKIGLPADLVLIDPQHEWVLTADQMLSRSRNTPLTGSRFKGRVIAAFVGGKQKWSLQ